MTRLASDGRWPPWPDARFVLCLGAGAALLVTAWLAGVVLLWALHLPVVHASPLTVWRSRAVSLPG